MTHKQDSEVGRTKKQTLTSRTHKQGCEADVFQQQDLQVGLTSRTHKQDSQAGLRSRIQKQDSVDRTQCQDSQKGLASRNHKHGSDALMHRWTYR